MFYKYIMVLCFASISLFASKGKVLFEDKEFKIMTSNTYKNLPKEVDVFGVKIYAVEDAENKKILHAANILAQYLDNNEDGKVDDRKTLKEMLKRKASLVIWKYESDLNEIEAKEYWQDLGNDEINIQWKASSFEPFDASIEEVLHLVSYVGYAYAYPEIFGENHHSKLAKAMDSARGGVFDKTPDSYPKDAWYTYDDETCDYKCQITEYFYWGLTSYLGAQENRTSVSHEWKFYNKEDFMAYDLNFVTILGENDLILPQNLPDGKYRKNK